MDCVFAYRRIFISVVIVELCYINVQNVYYLDVSEFAQYIDMGTILFVCYS